MTVMKRSSLIGAAVMIGAVIIVFIALQYSSSQFVTDIAGNDASDTGLSGTQAPYFDLPDLAGDHVRLSDYTDQPLIIVFWTTWNEQAADQLHILDEYLESSEDDLIQVVAISSQEEKSIVSSFVRRGGYGLQTLLDARGVTTEEYGVKSLPTTFFIRRDGTIAESFAGVLSQKMLVDKVENILR
jgi:peroxiredoxin